MQKNNISIFSFFSGSGFLDLGFENAGFSLDFVNEISPSFLRAHMHSREKMKLPPPYFGYSNTDINDYFSKDYHLIQKSIEEARLKRKLIGFIGGPPCPDFSIAGKNKGKDGENGVLSLNYINLIKEFEPDFFLFENVKGLWKTKKHREFYEALKLILFEAGYVTTEQLINSLEFAVPQDRERIFLFGIRKELLDESSYDEDKIINFPWESGKSHTLDDVQQISWPSTNEFNEDSISSPPENCILELTIQHWFTKNDVDNHPNSDKFFKPRSGVSKMLVIPEGDVSRKSFKRLHRWRYSPTAAYGNNEVHLHPFKVRRLSCSEALAIQSLPKEFELPNDMSLTDMFKTIGNGVPFLLSLSLANKISEYLDSNTSL